MEHDPSERGCLVQNISTLRLAWSTFRGLGGGVKRGPSANFLQTHFAGRHERTTVDCGGAEFSPTQITLICVATLASANRPTGVQMEPHARGFASGVVGVGCWCVAPGSGAGLGVAPHAPDGGSVTQGL